MKKRFLFTTIAAAAFATAALGIAACDDPEPEEQPEAPSPYTVTFDANGGAFASTVNTPVVLEVNAENKLAAFPTSNPTHASSATHDYSFAGWTVTKDTLPLLDLTKVYDQSTTVYAYWNTTPKQGGVTSTYTVTFHGNGGLWGTDTEKELTTNTSGLLASLPATPEHPDDKPFKGYTIGTTDTGNYIDATTPYTENTDVYAQWGERQVTTNPEGDGAVPGATVSTRLKLFINGTEHTVYNNPGTAAATEDYIENVVFQENDVVTLTDTSDSPVMFRYKASDEQMSSYTFHCTPASPVNVYIKTWPTNNVYELEMWNRYDEVGYDKNGNLITGNEQEDPGDETGITVKVGGVDAGSLSKNEGHSGQGTQYKVTGVSVASASAISFTDDDGAVSFYVDSASKGIDKSNTSTAVTSVMTTNSAAATYDFYLLYNTDGSHTLYATDGSADPLPEATDFDLLKSDGTKLGDFTTNPAKPTEESQLKNISLTVGDVIKISEDETPLSVWLNPSSKGIDINNKTSTLQSTISVTATGTFTFYMTNNSDGSHTLYCSYVAAVTPVEDRDVYLRGIIGGNAIWGDDASRKLTKISTNGDANMSEQYMITVTLQAGDKFKLFSAGVGDDDGWCNYVDGTVDGIQESGDIIVPATGFTTADYDIYFKIWKDGGYSIGISKHVA